MGEMAIIESKFFQLVLEEGGRYFMLQIFERGNIVSLKMAIYIINKL